MAIVKFYRDRPIKRMRQGPDGIILTFVSPTPGERGQQETITQKDWDTNGRTEVLPAGEVPDLRKLAAEYAAS